jgi:hypothetical protein
MSMVGKSSWETLFPGLKREQKIEKINTNVRQNQNFNYVVIKFLNLL